MKPSIHPTYHKDAMVTCSCGNSFTTGSVKKSLTVEVCSRCHPFFTGEERLIDTKGRAEEFSRRMKVAKKYKEKAGSKKVKKSGKQGGGKPKTLRELLSEV